MEWNDDMNYSIGDVLRLKAETDLESTINFLWKLTVDKQEMSIDEQETKYKLLKERKQAMYNILGIKNGI